MESHFLLMLTCWIVSMTVPTSDVSLQRFDHRICFSTTGMDHMKVIVVHVLLQRVGHGAVALVGVHNRRKDILLAADDFYCGFVCVGVK